jgi:hypothetical protein
MQFGAMEVRLSQYKAQKGGTTEAGALARSQLVFGFERDARLVLT